MSGRRKPEESVWERDVDLQGFGEVIRLVLEKSCFWCTSPIYFYSFPSNLSIYLNYFILISGYAGSWLLRMSSLWLQWARAILCCNAHCIVCNVLYVIVCNMVLYVILCNIVLYVMHNSHCGGFSYCTTRTLGTQVSVLGALGLRGCDTWL